MFDEQSSKDEVCWDALILPVVIIASAFGTLGIIWLFVWSIQTFKFLGVLIWIFVSIAGWLTFWFVVQRKKRPSTEKNDP